MKKKLILFLVLVLFVTGCSVQKLDVNNYDSVIYSYFNNKRNVKRDAFSGYSLHIPRGLKIDSKDSNNLILRDKYNNLYYVYIDVVSYYNKVNKKYKKYSGSYYYKDINNEKNNGFIEIIKDNKKYFVHGVYNYVKIEVYSSENSLSDTIINMCEVMSSIKYNDDIIKLSFDNNDLNYKEEEFNIFTSNRKKKGSYLEYVQNYDNAISSVENSGEDEDMIDVDMDE